MSRAFKLDHGDFMTMITNAALPEDVLVALDRLGNSLRVGGVLSQRLVDEAVAALNTLPVLRTISEIYSIQRKLGFYDWENHNSEYEKRERALHLLVCMPALAQVFTFHSNGYVREAALHALTDVPCSSFMLAILAVRLNDWVAPVRQAAVQCVEALSGRIDPAIVAAFGIELCGRWHEWSRWSPEQAACIESLFVQSAVHEQLVVQFAVRRSGPLPTALRYFLRKPGLDAALPMLARTAQVAGVRAIAVLVLLRGHARWQTGTRRQWLNKPHGISRTMPVLAQRDIEVSVDRHELISAVLCDKSAIVRRTALVALTDCATELPDLATFLPAFQQDDNSSVRRWAGYLLQQQEMMKTH